MKKIILYAKGIDRPGIISDITNEINLLNGNIETSKMIKLESIFNILMLVQIKEKKIISLKEKLNKISNLSIEFNNTEESDNQFEKMFFFRLKGADNEGIIHIFTNYFYKNKINILDLESEISNAPVTGQALFFLKSRILVPNNLNYSDIKNDLIDLSNKHNVAIKFKKFDISMDY